MTTADQAPPAHRCDHCRQVVRRDCNGWWVGDDDTSECPADAAGHEVDGSAR